MKELTGIHHVTAITSSAEKIYEFFTNVLGLRLVKKTINQDDIHAYHLFFADDSGSPGTDMTFFDFPGIQKAQKGTNEISITGFRVATDEALEYWLKRFNHYQIKYRSIERLFHRKVLFFEDFDGQQYALFSDQGIDGVQAGLPWKKGPVPDTYAIIGLGPIFFTVNQLDLMRNILLEKMMMRLVAKENQYTLFEMGEGGNGASVILIEDNNSSIGYQGYGAVHHVAFRVDDVNDIQAWVKRLEQFGARHSGLVDRFYFKSLYTRLYPNILFEFATEGPGFIDDQEDYETLGETLALPPRFRDNREKIESLVRPINTKRSHKTFKKEYF